MYRGKGNVPFAYDERWKKVPGGLGLWNLMLVHLPALWRSTQSGIADRIARPGGGGGGGGGGRPSFGRPAPGGYGAPPPSARPAKSKGSRRGLRGKVRSLN